MFVETKNYFKVPFSIIGFVLLQSNFSPFVRLLRLAGIKLISYYKFSLYIWIYRYISQYYFDSYSTIYTQLS